MDKAAQESDYSYVRKSFLYTEATSMQETIPSKELSSEYYYLWKKVSPKPNQKKKNMSINAQKQDKLSQNNLAVQAI